MANRMSALAVRRDAEQSDRDGRAPLSAQMHRLRERAVAGGIPHRKADPFLPSSFERNPEASRAKRRLVRRGDDLSADLLSIAPNRFDELQRKGPFHVGYHLALIAA